MAEHDDGTPPGSDLGAVFYGAEGRHITAREHEALRRRVHDVSDQLNADLGKQATRIAVLERRADDEEKHRGKSDAALEAIRRECEERSTDTRKYAATLVDGAKSEAKAMVEQLAKTWEGIRKDEREDRREEARAAMWRIGLIVGALTAAINLLSRYL